MIQIEKYSTCASSISSLELFTVARLVKERSLHLLSFQNNYEFGISRVIKAMEPQNRRLGTDTWYYAKRCLLAVTGHLFFLFLMKVLESLSTHLIVIRDKVIEDMDKFLVQCESNLSCSLAYHICTFSSWKRRSCCGRRSSHGRKCGFYQEYRNL